MSEWSPIEQARDMECYWIFHPYYSHGRVRHGYLNKKGYWIGINSDGTERELEFYPTHFQKIPYGPNDPINQGDTK